MFNLRVVSKDQGSIVQHGAQLALEVIGTKKGLG